LIKPWPGIEVALIGCVIVGVGWEMAVVVLSITVVVSFVVVVVVVHCFVVATISSCIVVVVVGVVLVVAWVAKEEVFTNSMGKFTEESSVGNTISEFVVETDWIVDVEVVSVVDGEVDIVDV